MINKIVILFILLFLVIFPFFGGSYEIHLFILSMIFGITAMYWNLLDGYIGIINFGYAGFFGIGAYCSALLSMRLGISPFLGLIIGGLMAGAIGVCITLPFLRLGKYAMCMATLAFSEILRVICSGWVDVTRGEKGLWGIPAFFPSSSASYYLVFSILLMGAYILYKIVNSKFGLAFMAIREDEIAAYVLGIDINKYKLLASFISCFFAGIAGALYAHYIQLLAPAIFGLSYTLQIMAMSLVGGKATIFGPLLGSFILTLLPEYFRFLADYRLIVYGLIIIIVVNLFPSGIFGGICYIRKSIENLFLRASQRVERKEITGFKRKIYTSGTKEAKK